MFVCVKSTNISSFSWRTAAAEMTHFIEERDIINVICLKGIRYYGQHEVFFNIKVKQRLEVIWRYITSLYLSVFINIRWYMFPLPDAVLTFRDYTSFLLFCQWQNVTTHVWKNAIQALIWIGLHDINCNMVCTFIHTLPCITSVCKTYHSSSVQYA